MTTHAHEMDWQALPLPTCSLGESPRYAHGGWMWVDINQHTLYRLNQADLFNPKPENLHVLNMPDEIGCVLPTANAHTLVALGRQGGWLIEQGVFTHKLASPFDATKHRFNDGRAALTNGWQEGVGVPLLVIDHVFDRLAVDGGEAVIGVHGG